VDFNQFQYLNKIIFYLFIKVTLFVNYSVFLVIILNHRRVIEKKNKNQITIFFLLHNSLLEVNFKHAGSIYLFLIYFSRTSFDYTLLKFLKKYTTLILKKTASRKLFLWQINLF